MGPAVTSEAVSCEQGERLRNTASLSPHNVHSTPIPLTGMSTDEPVDTAECHSAVDPCSSSQPVELSAGVLTPTSNGQMTCSRMNLSKVVDNRLLSVSLKQHNDNFVNIKEIQGCKKMSIFLKNNPCSVLPNGGLNCTSLPDETKTVQASACDETVPCGTVLPQLRLTKLSNSHQLQNNVVSGSKAPPVTIVSESQTTQSDGIRQPEVGSFSSSTVENDGNFSQPASVHECVSQAASEEAESRQIPSSVDEMLARQKSLNSRASGLLKRLRRLQCREVNSAAKEGLGRLASSLGQTVCEKTPAAVAQKTATKDTLGSRELTALSTAELVSYVQKMQLSHQQHVCQYRQPSSHGGSLPSAGNETEVTINDRVQSSMCRTAGQLSSNLRHLKSALDSDATESSSGGESGDERRPMSSREASDVAARRTVCKKLEADWAKDRSSIISRWTWLQAQVSDLEYRIRQQSDIYKQLRLSKGSLSLRDPPCSTGGPSNDCDVNGRIKPNRLSALADSENQKNSLASSSAARPVPNEGAPSSERFCAKPLLPRTRQSNVAELLPDGRLGASDTDTQTPYSCGTTSSSNCPTSAALDPTCRAARCLELHGVRRRTLLRSSAPHEVGRKASQLPTVRCACYPPATPCALCGGRYDRVVRPGPLNSTRNRLAILDPSYHSVLSFPKDVPLSLRMAESLWVGPIRDNNAAKYSFRPATVRVKSRTGSQPVSNEFQQEPEGVHEKSAKVQCHSGHRILSSTYRDRRACLHSMETMQKKKKKRLSMNRKRLSKASLRPSSFKSSRAQLLRRAYLMDNAQRRQTSGSAFDINDVVIPPHVSSAARIDIIQYKEIVTPKWRKISKDVSSTITSASMTAAFRYGKRPHPSASSENDCTKKVRWSGEELDPAKRFSAGEEETDAEEEFENLSDESFAARHLRYEIYEKKQCMPINVGHQRRSRSNRSESDSFTLLNPQSPDAGILDASASLTSSTLSVGPSTSCLGYSDAEDPSHHHVLGDGFLARQPSEARSGFSASCATVLCAAPYGSEQPSSSEQAENGAAQSWPPRTFPLGDFENEQLFAERPERGVDSRGVVRSASPAASTSTESTEPVGEDPDDPEWTVTARNKDKPGLLIRFAKV